METEPRQPAGVVECFVSLSPARGRAASFFGHGMPARSASVRTASTNETFSVSITKVKTFPPTPQPKQWYICFSG